MAYGVSFTHGKFASWRIFFLAIGAMTVVIGAIVCVLLPDSPVKTKKFTDEEKVAVLLRVKNNQRHVLCQQERIATIADMSQWYPKCPLEEEPNLGDI